MVLAGVAAPQNVFAQIPADPVLEGIALLGDTVLGRGTAVLHHLSATTEGEIDSVSIGSDGRFRLRLPNVPDPQRSDVFFASIRHDGVLYFGAAVTQAVQLDSLYHIQTFDTLLAPAAGLSLPVQTRNVFFEPDGERWRVTDLFEIVNRGDRTVVAREGGKIWSYPLPQGAIDPEVGHGETAPGVTAFEDGSVVLRGPVPPGERVILARYWLDEPFVEIPTPGGVGQLDVLVREPAPELEVDGLSFVERTELEAGTTYLHFAGANLQLPFVTVRAGASSSGPPPVGWAAFLVAMLLAGVGVYAIRGSGRAPAIVEPRAPPGRRELLVAVARLDHAHQSNPDPTPAEVAQYRRRRAELLARIRAEGS